jgi:hypothetical protein
MFHGLLVAIYGWIMQAAFVSLSSGLMVTANCRISGFDLRV